MKRFYKQAAAAAQDDMFSVVLDCRPIRTPGKNPLHLPTEGLAGAIAAEWAAQQETIKPHTMPLTQLASTALDRVAPQQAAISAEIARYAETDLVCYHAERPSELIQRQHAAWSPLVAWLEEEYGTKLLVTSGIQPIQQPADALAKLRDTVAGFGHFPLAGLSSAVSATGSAVIGLALVAGRISAEQAADAAFLDEIYQMEQWGRDAQEEARLAQLRADLMAVEHFLALLV